MARIAAGVTVAVNPKNPGDHKTAPQTAGSETGDVYVSYDNTKITGYAQLLSGVMAACASFRNGALPGSS